MFKYDADNFDPPAPVAYVALRDLVTGVSISDVPMLIDTGADVTLLPREAVSKLGVSPNKDILYEIQDFDGRTKMADMVELELTLLGKTFTGQFLLLDQPMGILGRNILNSLSLVLDGPKEKWDAQKK